MFDNTRKNGPKFFLHWKVTFFSKLCVLNKLLGFLKKCLYKFQSKSQNLSWTLIICSLMFFILDNTRKIRPKTFVIAKKAIFGMFVSVDHLGPNKCSYQLHNRYQNALWTLIYSSLTFVMFDNTRKIGPKSFLHWMVTFFFKTLCFEQTLRFLKKCLYKFQNKSQNILWILIICSLMFFMLDNTRKYRPKTFVIANKAIFWNVFFLSTT